MFFPEYRPRRMRMNENLRRMVRETRLSVDNLIYPLLLRRERGLKARYPPCRGTIGYP